MSIPLIDLNLKYIVDYTLKTVRSNPDKHLKDIFGDATLSPHDALYGDRMIQKVKAWIETTKITVILGYDLSQAELPAVTINLTESSPGQQFMGDAGPICDEPLQNQDLEVIVPQFAPKKLETNAERTLWYLELNDDMPQEQSELVMPGLLIRDAANKEWAIGFDDYVQKITLTPANNQPIDSLDSRWLEVISPLKIARFQRGIMQFRDTAQIAIHGHQNRNEGLWLWSIVVWGLLKFRPLMISVFGMDLQVPISGTLEMAPEFQGNNIWVRHITLSGTTVWSWEGPRMQDVIGLLLTVNQGRSGD